MDILRYSAGLAPQERYTMISELAYSIGEDRKQAGLVSDMASEWVEAQSQIDDLISLQYDNAN